MKGLKIPKRNRTQEKKNRVYNQTKNEILPEILCERHWRTKRQYILKNAIFVQSVWNNIEEEEEEEEEEERVRGRRREEREEWG